MVTAVSTLHDCQRQSLMLEATLSRSVPFFQETFLRLSCAARPVRCNDDDLNNQIEKTLMNTRTTAMKIEPYPCIRSRLPLAPRPALASEARAYLRRLRAAEMAAWELSGGDYLLSGSAYGIRAQSRR